MDVESPHDYSYRSGCDLGLFALSQEDTSMYMLQLSNNAEKREAKGTISVFP